MTVQRILGALAAAAWLAVAGLTARADEKGEAILRHAFKTLNAAKTYTANLAITINQPGQPRPISLKGTVAALKPNLLRVELKQAEGPGVIFAADGKKYYTYTEARKEYTKVDLEESPKEFQGEWEGEIDAFFGGESLLSKGETSYVGTETVGGVECDQVKVTPKGQGATVLYSIGKADHLIRRSEISFTQMGQTFRQTSLISDPRLNGAKKASDFSFTPPSDAKEVPAFRTGPSRPESRP
jgi:outer membrane lipoprotein-sorting protein